MSEHLDGAASIAAECRRIETEEGFDAAHDAAEYPNTTPLVAAAIAYAIAGKSLIAARIAREERGTFNRVWSECVHFWPWVLAWWKPTTQRRNLVKAGALIAKAIDRHDAIEAERAKRGANA